MSQSNSYSETEAQELLRDLAPGWSVSDGHLRREYKTVDWRTSMLLANGISHLAEAAWHHPDLEIGWGRVVVLLRTHSEDAITDKDLELARLIEQTACWRPGSSSALEGVPQEGQWRYLAGD